MKHILKSDFDIFLDQKDSLFTRRQYKEMQERLKFIQNKADRSRRLTSRDEEEVKSIEYILNEYENAFREWRKNK
ncbi:MAG: hypothetical protein E6Q35_02315 [Chryseobacterium cucumeris]|nr:MAG: hypothetical protein E6Q35_02315 [Chryseobacterium cucumeris]